MMGSRCSGPIGPALLGLAILIVVAAPDVRAGNIVQDPGFELADPGAAPGATTPFPSPASIDGGYWFVTQGTVRVDTYNQYVYDGNKSVYLNGDDQGMGPDSLTQTLATIAGQVYTIGFWANADNANTVLVDFSPTGGSLTQVASFNIIANGFPSVDPLGNSGQFTYYSVTALATSDSTDLTLTGSSPSANTTVEIDDVSVTAGSITVVPEPASLILAGIGVLGGVVFARRRCKP